MADDYDQSGHGENQEQTSPNDGEKTRTDKEEETAQDDRGAELEEAGESLGSDYDVGSRHGCGSTEIVYGEDYGEDGYYVPRPSSEAEARDSVEEVESPGTEVTSQGSDKVREGQEGHEEQEGEEEEEEGRESPGGLTLTRSEELEPLTTESIFEALYLQPKEKTVSEVLFESEHREIIEEEMRKFVNRRALKEEIVIEKRKPLEKPKITLTDVDVSGLYPQPKTIESEVSFVFDEDEEVERGMARPPLETDADIVKAVVDSLRDSTKGDPEGIFTRGPAGAISRLQRAIEEAVAVVKREGIVTATKTINDFLPELKPNLRQTAIRIISEKLSRYEKVAEAEEEEQEEVKRSIKKEGPKARAADFILEREELKDIKTEKHVKMQAEKPVEKQRLTKAVDGTERKPVLPVTSEKRTISTMEKEAVEEEPEPMAYEKIDWELFLTESEKRIAADPRLKSEMDKYIERRKKELLLEKKAEEDLIAREERYKSKDPGIMLENVNLFVTMKFVLNTGEIFTCAYRYFMPFREIKEDLAGIFRVPPDVLIIYRDEEEVKDEESAHDLTPKIEPFECVTFRLLTLDNDRWRLKSSHLELPVPDIITCTVETGLDYTGEPEYKEVVVEIEQRKIKKPFVGGYRDVCTGIEYHHAFSQSAPREPTLPYNRRVSTDTQTAEYKSKSVDTDCDKYTQISRSDFYVSTEQDRIVTPQPYVDYDTWIKQKDMENKIALIQRYVRAMIIRKFVRKMTDEYRARKMCEEEEHRKQKVNREIRVKRDIINMVYPKTKADFEALYAMVERWRKAQVERIGKLKTEAPRKAELCAVLEKEIKLLEAIEVHRIAVSKEQKKKKELDFLAKVSKPVTWTGYRGMTIKMDTVKTQRARELRELYLALSRDDLNYQDRIELLIALKYALGVNCTRLTDELTSLLNRECEMLIRGVGSSKMEYLRRRIDHLFLKFFKEPDFNPEVAKYDPDYNREPIKQNVIFCKMCHQMKTYKDFEVNARDTSCNVCQSCKTTYNIAIPRIDLNPYRYILKCVRKDEQKRNCYSSCAFILQDEDMRFLVENIWHSRSAISEDSNLMDLRMPRWDRDKDWTPWNCILLTETEAKAHLRGHPSVNYEKQLIGEIVTKHQLAKRHFQQMFATEERMRDSGKWANVVDIKKYTPPPITADIWDLTGSECTRIIKEKQPLYVVHETRRKDDNYVKYI